MQLKLTDELLSAAESFLAGNICLRVADRDGALEDVAINRLRVRRQRFGHDAFVETVEAWMADGKHAQLRRVPRLGPRFKSHLQAELGIQNARMSLPICVPEKMRLTPLGRELMWRDSAIRRDHDKEFGVDVTRTFKHELHRLLVAFDYDVHVSNSVLLAFAGRFAKSHRRLTFVCPSTPLLWLTTLESKLGHQPERELLVDARARHNHYIAQRIDKNLDVTVGARNQGADERLPVTELAETVTQWLHEIQNVTEGGGPARWEA